MPFRSAVVSAALALPAVLLAQDPPRHGPTDRVRGRVLDAQTLRPIEGARVVAASDTLLRAQTGPDGRFELRGAARELVVRRLGYAPHRVRVGAGELAVTLVPAGSQLEAVQVTGFETDRPLLETPGAVALVTERQLARYDNTSILPALNAVPGVRVDQRSPGGSTRLSIRGSVLRSAFGIRNVRVYWNEIPLTLADGTSPADVFDVAAAGTVEILKGPAGSVYGAGTGGVVKLQSPRTGGETGPELTYTGGQYGLARVSGAYRVTGERATFTASALRQDSDGYRTAQDHARRELYQVQGQLFPSDRTTVSVYAYHARPRFGLPGNLTRAEYDLDPRQPIPWSAYYEADARRQRTYAGGSVAQQLAGWLSAQTSLYGTFTDWEGNSGTTRTNGSVIEEAGSGYGGRARLTAETPAGALPAGMRGRLVVGGEFQTDHVRNQSFALDTLRARRGLASNSALRSTQYLLFGQAEADLPAQVLLTAGVSYNSTRFDVRDHTGVGAANTTGRLRFDPTVAPRVAAVKAFGDRAAVHASVSVGYSPPTSFELNPSGTVNRGLRAERGTQYEVGARGTLLGRRLSGELSAFSLGLRNTIVGLTNERGFTEYENAGSTEQRGLEASLALDAVRPDDGRFVTLLRPWATAAANDFTFRDWRVRNAQSGTTTTLSGLRLPGVPLQTTTLALDLETRPGAYANLTHQRVGRVQLTNANTVSADPYALLTVRAGVRRGVALPGTARLTVDVFGGVDNALDAKYSSFLAINGFGGRYFNPSLPRNYFGGVTLRAAR